MESEIRIMTIKLENYKRIKGILTSAKQTFLNEKGQEIMPTLENLVVFKQQISSLLRMLDEIEERLHV